VKHLNHLITVLLNNNNNSKILKYVHNQPLNTEQSTILIEKRNEKNEIIEISPIKSERINQD
jgi:hypothetical protein